MIRVWIHNYVWIGYLGLSKFWVVNGICWGAYSVRRCNRDARLLLHDELLNAILRVWS